MKLIDLLQLLDSLYSREEFQTLCFTMEIDYEHFEAQGKKNQMQEMLTLLRRHNRLPELIDILQQERPQAHSDWPSVQQAMIILQKQSGVVSADDQALSDINFANDRGELLGHQLGNYQLVEKLGEGGMAEVYKGYSAELETFVAVKVMHTLLTTQTESVARFRREAKVLAALNHPHIVRLLEYKAQSHKTFYLVMEYIKGPSLRDYLEARLNAEKLLPLSESVSLILQIADALAYAHQQGLVHRDVKPANVMINEEGKAILMDFGIVKLLNGQNASFYTATGAFMGTPSYVSPEQALGGQGDIRADIYALGVMLFYMTTGHLPFTADATMAVIMKHISEPVPLPESYNSNIPFRLQEVILRAMEKDPNSRYATMDEMIKAIQLINLEGVATPIFTRLATPQTDIPELILSETTDSSKNRLRAPFHVPPPIPYFAGRSQIVADLMVKLVDSNSGPIVGLMGFGGVGKTAVAIHAARQLQDAFPDGILWAQLDTATVEAELTSFAHAYGQAEALAKLPDLPTKAEFVREILADKKVLIILDQVNDSEQIKWLIPTGQENKTLITTRNGKLLKNLRAAIVPLLALTIDEGIVLLHEMVGKRRVEAEAEAAQQIVRNTGGIPLALSIAAGFLNEATDLTLSEYADLLNDEQERLDHLSDWDDATRDISASFELSYQALPERLQKLFAVLSIFDGPDFDSHAVATILQMPTAQVKLGLGRLYFLSLISAGLGERDQLFPIESDGNGRYRLNPLLKLFARRKLNGEDDLSLRQRALDYYLQMAEKNQTLTHFHNLDLEWTNIIHLLTWAHENQKYSEYRRGVLALTHWQMGILGFLDVRGLWANAHHLLSCAIASQPDISNVTDLDLRLRLAILSARQSDNDSARHWLSEVETHLHLFPDDKTITLHHATIHYTHYLLAYGEAGQTRLSHLQKALQVLEKDNTLIIQIDKAYLLTRIADTLYRLGNFSESLTAAKKALNQLPPDHSSAITINALNSLSLASRDLGDLPSSHRYLETALQTANKLNDMRLLAFLWMNKGILEDLQGQWADASKSQKEALQLYRYMGNFREEIGCLLNLGLIDLRLGKTEQATTYLQQAITLAKTHQVPEFEALACVYLTILHLQAQDYTQASQALLQAEELTRRLQLGYLWPAVYYLQAELNLALNNLQSALKLAEQAVNQAQASQYKGEEGIAWRVLGQVHLALGQIAAARQAYETSLSLLQGDDKYEYARTQLALADFFVQTQQIPAAKEMLDTAAAIFNQLQAKQEIQQVQNLTAQIEQIAT